MNKRSRYWGCDCAGCTKTIAEGRIALCSTYYVSRLTAGTDVDAVQQSPPSQSRTKHLKNSNWGFETKEIQVHIAFHRRCLERVLSNAPLESDETKERFEQYRAELLETYDPL